MAGPYKATGGVIFDGNSDVVGKFETRRGDRAELLVKRANLHDEFVDACKAVLLFHSGVPWDYKAKAEWSKLVGPDNEATTRGLCDSIRDVLAQAL